jgi:transmembrane sensor
MSAPERHDVFAPEVPPARLERQWSAIRERLPESTAKAHAWSPWKFATLGLVAALAALLAWNLAGNFAGPGAHETTLAEGSALETNDLAELETRAELSEGSEVALSPSSRIEVLASEGAEVRLALRRGRARFDVVRNPERSFRVIAETAHGDAIEVRVVGTRFEVTRGDEVEVTVERGIVEVRVRDAVHRLTAGERWSSSELVIEAEAPAPEPAAPTLEMEPEAEGPTPDLVHIARPREPDARTLFDQAREARQAGSVAEAARLYDTLLRSHDDDPRAGIAAFELARLRMDSLGDPRGAVRALDRALAGEGGSYREDAMARRATLLARLNRASECRSARDAYLAQFPAGVHVRAVRELCP